MAPRAFSFEPFPLVTDHRKKQPTVFVVTHSTFAFFSLVYGRARGSTAIMMRITEVKNYFTEFIDSIKHSVVRFHVSKIIEVFNF